MRRWYVWVTISVALFAVLLWRTRPWDALAIGARPGPLAAAVALNAAVVAAWAIRSARLMAAVGHPLPLRSIVLIVSFANTINNLTPASSGEALRAMILRRRHSVPVAHSAAVILAERFWAVWIMAVSAAAAAIGTLVEAPPGAVAAAWMAAVGAAVAPAIAHRAGFRPAAFVAGLLDPGGAAGWRARVAAALRDLDASLGAILASGAVATNFVGSTAIVFVAFTVQLWLILSALGSDVPLVGAWAALGIATIAGVLSALPFGLGAADVVMSALLIAQGVPPPVAGAAALLLRATVTLPLGLAGTASWIALNHGPSASSEADARRAEPTES